MIMARYLRRVTVCQMFKCTISKFWQAEYISGYNFGQVSTVITNGVVDRSIVFQNRNQLG